MLLPRCSVWCLFCLCLAACDLKTSELVSDELTCSEGLSDCSIRDDLPFWPRDEDSLRVQNLTAYFKLCCEKNALCTLCMGIDLEVNISQERDTLDEDHSGLGEEDYDEEARIPKVEFVAVCYCAVNSMPVCKRVEFAINNVTDTRQQHAKISLVITRPLGVSYSSHVIVYPYRVSRLRQDVTAPSLDEVCSKTVQKYVQECHVPKLSSIINPEMNRVELHPVESNDTDLSLCVQYERNGRCQKRSEMNIPLYSVTPCMCVQAWKDSDQRSTRSLSCPFQTSGFQNNVWQNISLSLAKGQINHFGSMLWWNLSAPCRLSGEVWLLHEQGRRQQLSNGTWRQNKKGLWERPGVFEDIDAQLLPCVMVKVEGKTTELGPYCLHNISRGRWSLLLVGLPLLACLSVLTFCLLRGSIKKWAWRSRRSGLVKIWGKSHVLLVSPPHVDEAVAESVSQLGSLLAGRGFSVCVDQWNREEQCAVGPVPWLHSQLLELKRQRGRIVLVLTRESAEAADEWMRREAARAGDGDGSVPRMESPYSGVFTACLLLVHAAKQEARARELFILVRFDSKACKDRSLPELFRGLPLFHLPSQTRALLTALTVGSARRRPTTRWRRGSLGGLGAKGAEEEKLQVALLG